MRRNFEEILRHYFPSYAGLEEAAKKTGIESKPFIARWVAERMDRHNREEGWKKFSVLTTAIKRVLTNSS